MKKHFWAPLALTLLLALSAALPAAAQSSCGSTVTVARGDTLSAIAARCGTTVAALLQANPGLAAHPNLIYPGQTLNVPGSTGPGSGGTTASSYVVQPGDTLSRIAARFGTTVTALLRANPQVTNPNLIFVGQRLTIPGTSPTPGTGATRINFAAGATSANVQGAVAARGTNSYVLAASAGQEMEVSIANPTASNNVILIVYGADGAVLLSDHAGAAFFRGVLPTTQDYHIDVRSVVDTSTDYTLSVIIAQRIAFAPGATSATASATTPVNEMHNFVVRASAGQTLNVSTSAAQGQVILIIFGADGDVLISDHAGATSFTGKLPTTQDYRIDVRSVGSVPAVYTLTVTIPPS